ncbi:MAG: hypothetical protein VKQ33_11780 [Candidatus Sericytochromatia bacterium]|nr:hypothetical protein [Candidatus Sericytochromatia bacterium]
MSKIANGKASGSNKAGGGKPQGKDAGKAAQAQKAADEAAKAKKAAAEADKRAKAHAAERAAELARAARADMGPLPFILGGPSSSQQDKAEGKNKQDKVEGKNKQDKAEGKNKQDKAEGKHDRVTKLADRLARAASDLDRAVDAQVDIGKRIKQVGGRDTCAAAEAQHHWATSNPEEYARVAKQLMKHGEATIVRDGQKHVLSVDGNFQDKRNSAWIAQQGFDLNEKLNATMQAALMNLGVGGYRRNASYDMAANRAQGGQSNGNAGMSVLDTWRLGNRLSGQQPLLGTNTPPEQRDADSDGLPGGAIKTVDAAFAAVKEAAREGKHATVLVGAGKGRAHMVRVVDVTAGQVTIRTPDGLQSFSEAEFKQKMDVDVRRLGDGDIGTWGSYGTTSWTSGARTRTTTTR